MKLYEAIQLTHLEHIEDLPITDGVDGIKASIQFLKDNVDILKGHGNAEVFRKIDGCVHRDTELMTDIGIKTISEIVDQKINCNVLGYDFKKNIEIYTPVKNFMKNNNDKKWIKLILENNEEIILTQDHKCFIDGRGWIEAKYIREEDSIFSISENILEIKKGSE